jgi:transcriptional regulator with XRE-family HTH domain
MLRAMGAKAGGATPAAPRVGEVIRRLRTQRGLSVRGLAEQAGISASFLGAVERGESDIALGRLAQVAGSLDHDVASLLGYSLRQSTPRRIEPVTSKRTRGRGVEFSAFRVPGTHLELLVATFEPGTQFDDVVTHAGLDVMYITKGELVLVVEGEDYVLCEGECVVWPSSHPHTMRNDSADSAVAVGFTTETVY